MLGLSWFRMKKQNSAFSEFCNVGARPVYALSFSNSARASVCVFYYCRTYYKAVPSLVGGGEWRTCAMTFCAVM
jgi:hypothetical protein